MSPTLSPYRIQAPHLPSLEPLETTPTDRNEHVASQLEKTATWPRQLERVEAIRYCCTDAAVYWSLEGVLVYPRRCRERLCPRCQAALRARYAAEIRWRVQHYSHPKHLVLTLRSSDAPLRDQVKRLKSAFGRLRATATWKALAGRGVYTFEVTRNPVTRAWHPHLHVLVNAAYIPHDWLSKTWLRITKDSSVVFIKKATPGHAAYLAKYIGKPLTGDVHEWEEWPIADELKGLRVCDTFGGEEPIRQHSREDDPRELRYLGRLSELRRRAENGEIMASSWLHQLEDTGQLDKLKLRNVTSSW